MRNFFGGHVPEPPLSVLAARQNGVALRAQGDGSHLRCHVPALAPRARRWGQFQSRTVRFLPPVAMTGPSGEKAAPRPPPRAATAQPSGGPCLRPIGRRRRGSCADHNRLVVRAQRDGQYGVAAIVHEGRKTGLNSGSRFPQPRGGVLAPR